MTTRYLTTDQNGNGDQTYWDINGYFLHGPSGEKLNLGGGNTTVTASNEIVQIGTSYIRIPQGVSNERPIPSYAGMIRYLTTDNIIEYYDGNLQQWLAISQPPPNLNTVSPAFFNIGTDNSFNLTGSSFGTTGASIVVIGNNGSGTIINSTVSSVINESSAVVQFDASATQNLTDISNELPFAMRITNNNSGLSSLLQNAITNANVGPIIIQPNPQTVPFYTFPVQDPSAYYHLIGEDESSPPHYPFPSNGITITSGTAGGITDISFIDPSGALISVPSGNKTLATAGNYPFNVRVEDGSGAFTTTTLTLALADPIVTSVVPSTIDVGTVDLSVNGNYFVIDSGVSYVRQSDGSVVTPSSTTYNSITSLDTNVTFSNDTTSDIIYDISVNNGSVFKLYTSVLTVRTKFIIFSYTQTSGTTLTPTISYEDSGKNPSGGPVNGGYTVVKFVPTSTDYTQNYQWDISFSNTTTISEILVVGGGGCGSNDTNNTQGNGGGGAGGFRETNSLAQSFTQGTNYVVQCGRPGQQNPTGSQTTADGQTTINTAPSGGDTARSAYASGISTGSTNIYVASGGGNGGFYNGNRGGYGGSGAGGGRNGPGGLGNIGSYTPSEGNNGVGSGSFGGGGGGAGAAGSGQNGGNGKTSTYFSGTYAGGGGGSGSSYGSGGSGGGGSGRASGSTSYQVGYWGLPGTGGGGGATSNYPSSPGGAGRVEFRFLSFA